MGTSTFFRLLNVPPPGRQKILSSYDASVINNMNHITSHSGHLKKYFSYNSLSRELSPLKNHLINPKKTPTNHHDSSFVEIFHPTSPLEP